MQEDSPIQIPIPCAIRKLDSNILARRNTPSLTSGCPCRRRRAKLNLALTAYKDAIQLFLPAAWVGQRVESKLAADAAA